MRIKSDLTLQDVSVESTDILSDGFLQVINYGLRHKTFVGPQSQLVHREVCVRSAAAAVLPYDQNQDTLVLIEQFRCGVMAAGDAPWILEVVAGILEQNETPEEVAQREAFEESGCVIEQLIPVASYYTTPGSFSEKIYLFCGLTTLKNSGGLYGLAHEGEDIKAHVVSASKALAMLDDGDINNATTIIVLQWLREYRRRLFKEKKV